MLISAVCYHVDLTAMVMVMMMVMVKQRKDCEDDDGKPWNSVPATVFPHFCNLSSLIMAVSRRFPYYVQLFYVGTGNSLDFIYLFICFFL